MALSCIAKILCMFAVPYGSYMAPLCKHPDDIIQLIQYSGVKIPAQYTKDSCDANDLSAAYDFLLEVTQNKFRNRKVNQERAEAETPEWIKSKEQEIIDIAIKLNLIAENPPHKKQYDCAAILGSTTPDMEKRIGYFVANVKKGLKVKDVFLLTGERYIDSKKYNDGSDEYLEGLARKLGLEKSQLSEQHLMQDVYDRCCLTQPACKAIPYKLVYSEPTTHARAQTIDTLEDFAKNYLNNGQCKSLVFVSTAPFIQYQYEIIYKFMKDKGYNIPYEVIGSGAKHKEAPNLTKAAHYILMALAEGLHASRDRIQSSTEKN
jgi:hypothetical protein